MITSKIISKLALVIVAVATLALNGCSMIGLTTGASVDSEKSNQKIVPGWQVMTIAPGTRITIILKDGTRLSGKYSGLDPIPAEQYAAIYSQAREQKAEGILLPALGERIDIGLFLEKAKEPEKKLEGIFEGFGHDRVLFKFKGTTTLSDLPLSFVTKIAGSGGHVIAGETLKRLILEGKIPVLSAIVVEGKAGKTLVAMDNVSQMEIPVKKDGAWTGFGIGAAIDIAIVFYIVAQFKGDWLSLGGYGEM